MQVVLCSTYSPQSLYTSFQYWAETTMMQAFLQKMNHDSRRRP